MSLLPLPASRHQDAASTAVPTGQPAGWRLYLPAREPITVFALRPTCSGDGSRAWGSEGGSPGNHGDLGFAPWAPYPWGDQGNDSVTIYVTLASAPPRLQGPSCSGSANLPALISTTLFLTHLASALQSVRLPPTPGPLHLLPGHLSHGWLLLPIPVRASVPLSSSLPSLPYENSCQSPWHTPSFISSLALT